MKYVFQDLENIKRKIKTQGFVVFLDFDLTLSPLAKDPTRAFLSKPTKKLLKGLRKHMPAIIITGRKLGDIKKRVGIRGMLYIGNHGLEHNLNGTNTAFKISPIVRKALSKIKRRLAGIRKSYPGIVFENKKFSIALGYRKIEPRHIRSLESLFRRMQNLVQTEDILETRLDKKTFEVRPKTGINKGTACTLALKAIQGKYHKKFTPIYIGDSKTDEDAFVALERNGITIRVGKSNKSKAKWYLRNQKEVNKFLGWLLL